MKSLVLSIALLFGMTTAVYAEAEKAKVCVDVKDKEGKDIFDVLLCNISSKKQNILELLEKNI